MVARVGGGRAPATRGLWERAGIFVVLGLVAPGCSLGGGRLAFVPVGSEEPGFKMLLPDAEARACGAVAWPYGRRPGNGLLERAIAELVARNPEADTIRDLHLAWRGIDLVVAEIGCVSISGDVGRGIPTVRLPLVGEHGEHTGHTGAPHSE